MRHEFVLAGCAQALLTPAEDEKKQQGVLSQSLEYLRLSTHACNAYIVRNHTDPEVGICFNMFAETCTPEVDQHIPTPSFLKYPASNYPLDIVKKLSAGKLVKGSVEDLFKNTPNLVEMFLTRKDPVHSILMVPIILADHWWGFIGFEYCRAEKEWGKEETSLLRTTAEMIGSTLQGWESRAQLNKTLKILETKVDARNKKLEDINLKLREEIGQYQHTRQDLKRRLQIENRLVAISDRLLEHSLMRTNIKAALEDLGWIMKAGRVYVIKFEKHDIEHAREIIEWCDEKFDPISENAAQDFLEMMKDYQAQLKNGEKITIFNEDDNQTILASSICVEGNVCGILVCTNFLETKNVIEKKQCAFDLVLGMLKGLRQREYYVETLEEQINQRTRQLMAFLDMTMLNDQAQVLEDILQPTLIAIMEIVECDACCIHTINRDQACLELTAQRGIPLGDMQRLREVEIGKKFQNWIKTHYQNGGESSPGVEIVFPEPFYFSGFPTFYATQLHAGENAIGMLSSYRETDRPFSSLQITILSAIGDLLGVIVENHRFRLEAEEVATLEERQRLAREIHDAVSQSVYSLSLFARSAQDAQQIGDTDALSENLMDIETTALQAMREMRLLLYQLRISEEQKDIYSALENRFNQVERRLGMQAGYTAMEKFSLPKEVQHEVWRIITEALNNIIKHANASEVNVTLAYKAGKLFITIIDNGSGFEISHGLPGMGLKNMQSRAEDLGGRLSLISDIKKGTRVEMELPIDGKILKKDEI